MDPSTAIRLQALRTILSPEWDSEYGVRRLYRWYSKTFFTPLAQALEVPFEDVLRAFWEDKYESLSEEELEEERQLLLESDEARRKREYDDYRGRVEDEVWAKQVEEEERAKAAKAQLPDQKKIDPALAPKPAPLPPLPRKRSQAETELPTTDPVIKNDPVLTVIPPDITMEFSASDLFDNELDGLETMSQSERPPKP